MISQIEIGNKRIDILIRILRNLHDKTRLRNTGKDPYNPTRKLALIVFLKWKSGSILILSDHILYFHFYKFFFFFT